MVNKVKRGIKFHTGYGTIKYDWICTECGLVWRNRHQAQDCNHEPFYLNYYGVVFKARRKVDLEAI